MKKLFLFLIVFFILFFCLDAFAFTYPFYSVEPIDLNNNTGQGGHMIMNTDNNRPVFSYYDASNGNVKFGDLNGLTWKIEIIDGNSFSFSIDDHPTAFLLRDSLKNFHVIYYGFDGTNNVLKHAKRISAGKWDIRIIDGNSGAGTFASADIDGSNNIYASYRSNSNLKYAYWNGTSWSLSTVDANGSFCTFGTLRLDSSNNPYIAYRGASSSLGMAFKNGAVWEINTIAALINGEVGFDFNSGNFAYVVWQDTGNAQNVSIGKVGSWSSTSISGGNAGTNNFVKIISTIDENAHIISGDSTGVSHKWAVYPNNTAGNNGFAQNYLQRLSSTSWRTSLDFSLDNNAHFAWFQNFGSKYAWYAKASTNIPSVALIEPNLPRYFNLGNTTDGNYPVKFSVSYSDSNNLFASIWFSPTQKDLNNLLVFDLNLANAALNPTADANCSGLDFSTGQTCFIDVNVLKGIDNNYFLFLDVFDSKDFDHNSDYSDFAFNVIHNIPSVNIVFLDNSSDALPLQFSHFKDHNITIGFRVSETIGADIEVSVWRSITPTGKTSSIFLDLNISKSFCLTDLNAISQTYCTLDDNISWVPDGNYYYLIEATSAGTVSNSTEFATGFLIDNNVPTYTIDLNRFDAWSTVHKKDQNVFINASDATSDVNAIAYDWNGQGYRFTPFDLNILQQTDGNTFLQWFVIDKVGNICDTNQIYILVDKNASRITTFGSDINTTTSSKSPTISWTGTDNLSGFNGCMINEYFGEVFNKFGTATCLSGNCSWTSSKVFGNGESLFVDINCSDNIGNVSPYYRSYKVTYRDPEAGSDNPGAGGGGGITGSTETITLSLVKITPLQKIVSVAQGQKSRYTILIESLADATIALNVSFSQSIQPFIKPITTFDKINPQETLKFEYEVELPGDSNDSFAVNGKVLVDIANGQESKEIDLKLQRGTDILGLFSAEFAGIPLIAFIGIILILFFVWGELK